MQAVEGIRAAGGDIKPELVHRDWEVQRQMEENRLMETKYNERYKKLYMSLDGGI